MNFQRQLICSQELYGASFFVIKKIADVTKQLGVEEPIVLAVTPEIANFDD